MVGIALRCNVVYSKQSHLDMLLLAHFIGNSPSLLTHDQNWVPICLPTFNSRGYLQAYVASLHDEADSGSRMTSQAAVDLSAPCLVLISSSSDSSVFKKMHDSRQIFAESMQVCNAFSSIRDAGALRQRIRKFLLCQVGAHSNRIFAVSGILATVSALQFFYKYKGELGGSRLPAQCIWFSSSSEQSTSQQGTAADNEDILCAFPQLRCYKGNVYDRWHWRYTFDLFSLTIYPTEYG